MSGKDPSDERGTLSYGTSQFNKGGERRSGSYRDDDAIDVEINAEYTEEEAAGVLRGEERRKGQQDYEALFRDVVANNPVKTDEEAKLDTAGKKTSKKSQDSRKGAANESKNKSEEAWRKATNYQSASVYSGRRNRQTMLTAEEEEMVTVPKRKNNWWKVLLVIALFLVLGEVLFLVGNSYIRAQKKKQEAEKSTEVAEKPTQKTEPTTAPEKESGNETAAPAETETEPVETEPETIDYYAAVLYDENLDYSSVFDADYYAKNNPEAAPFADSDTALLNHFVAEGMARGFMANDSFNVYMYQNNYFGLRYRFGNDLASYYMDYIKEGSINGRRGDKMRYETVYNGVDYAPVYDYYYYISKNADAKSIASTGAAKVLEHFVTEGIPAGDVARENFNVNSYRKNYSDLADLSNRDLVSHYLTTGVKEGRVGYLVVDEAGNSYQEQYDYYKFISHNMDLAVQAGYDETKVFELYLTKGIAEGRTAK